MCSSLRYALSRLHMFMILGILNEQLSVGFTMWCDDLHDTAVAACFSNDLKALRIHGYVWSIPSFSFQFVLSCPYFFYKILCSNFLDELLWNIVLHLRTTNCDLNGAIWRLRWEKFGRIVKMIDVWDVIENSFFILNWIVSRIMVVIKKTWHKQHKILLKFHARFNVQSLFTLCTWHWNVLNSNYINTITKV